jgi:protein O-mannosyl-transferase
VQEKVKNPISNTRLLQILTAAVCVIVFVVHWPALSTKAFSIDDDQYLMNNILVQNPSWASAGRFLTEVLEPSTVGGYYQPLAMISLMGDVAMGAGPDNFVPFHRTSLILHTANTALVIILLYLLFGRIWAAVGIGLLFGLHPMTVETIAWVSERKTLVAAFFAFLTLIMYVRYARGGSWKFYTACLLTFVLALMSKPITVPLPIAMLLMDFWPLKRLNRRAITEKLPFFALAVVGAIIAYISQKRTASVTLPSVYGPEHIPLFICHDIVFYIYKIFWPAHLSSYYPLPYPSNLTNPMFAAGVIGTCILVPLLIISLRCTRALLTGWLIFLIMALPTMQIVGFSNVIASDKFAYLPSIGLLMVLTAFMCWFCVKGNVRRYLLASIIVLVLAGAESVATRQYLTHWQSTLMLTQYMLEQTPGEPQLLNLMGYAYQKEGRLDEAENSYRKALEKSPGFSDAHNNLGMVLKLQGRFDEAAEHYRKALIVEPNNAIIHFNLGNTLQSLGKLDEAVSQFQEALKIRPGHVHTHLNLASALAEQGKLDEALVHYRKIMNVKPFDAIVCNNIGLTLQDQGKIDEAIEYYTQALRMKRDFPDAYYNLIYAVAQRKGFDEVIGYFRDVLQIKLGEAEAHNFYGMGLQARGKSDEAVGQFQLALKLKPDFLDVYRNLAFSFKSQGKINEAIAQYNKAMQIKPDDAELHLKVGDLLASQNKLDEAIGHFGQAVRLEPNNVQAHYDMGYAFMMKDSPREAIEHLGIAMQLKPNWTEPAMWLARILATYPDPAIRDPNNAVRIATQAAEITNYRNPEVLEVLAVSYAASGQYDIAVKVVQEALSLAKTSQNTEMVNRLRDILEQYKGHIKVESPGKTENSSQ